MGEGRRGVTAMARNAIALLIVVVAAGCAGLRGDPTDTGAPAAAIPDLSRLAGRWQGTLYETGGAYTSGFTPLDITLAPDGVWQGTVGKSPAAGRARMEDGRMVLSGTVTGAGGRPEALYYQLKGDGERRWGETIATFSSGRASVSLERAPES